MKELSYAAFQNALRTVSIAHVIRGELNLSEAHAIQEYVLFAIWREALKRVLEEDDSEAFSGLSEEQQRNYFKEDSEFQFERFRDRFLESVRKGKGITLH